MIFKMSTYVLLLGIIFITGSLAVQEESSEFALAQRERRVKDVRLAMVSIGQYKAESFNSDLSSWDVSNVTSMRWTFN